MSATTLEMMVKKVESGRVRVANECRAMLAFLDKLDDAATLRECNAQAKAVLAYLATRKDTSTEDHNAALKIKLKVEHRLGEVLAETVKAGNPKLNCDTLSQLPDEITRKQSSRAQQLARIPWEKIDAKIDALTLPPPQKGSAVGVVNPFLEEQREADRAARAEAALSKLKNVPDFHEGDFREVAKTFPDDSVDLIFTDPPYDRKTLPLYGDLAEIAARILQPGGSLVCYLGQYLIPDVLDLLTPHLRLWWTLAVVHTGTLARMNEYGVIVRWKPLLWFVKETRGNRKVFVEDAVFSAQEKDTHDWQQSVLEARYYIGNLVPEKGLVFDPFCGGGTTARACKELGIRCITCDIDSTALGLAKERFSA